MEDRYTDKDYWEDYYKNNKVNSKRINKIVSEYNYYWEKLIQVCTKEPKSIIEIGAYPGRYLACLAAKYNLKPTALDYNSDVSKIEACFKLFNVEDYKLIQADFLKFEPEQKYDLVISNGFVEHFEDFENVMDRHCKYLAPGGAMLIMIPNKRYLRKFYSEMVDRANLKLHNLKIMDVTVFEKFAARNALNINVLEYFGGFNFNIHQKLNWIQSVIHKSFRQVFKRINPYIKKHPNKYLSSTLIAIYTWKGDS